MKRQTVLIISLAAMLVGTAQASQEQLATSIADTRLETARTSEQLKATLAALNGLTKQTKGDLRPTYDIYCAEVARTDAAAEWTRTRAQWMVSDGRQYFNDWQATIDAIANDSLQKQAQKRLNTVQASYNRVEKALKEAGQKFQPFLTDLADIQKALAADVTPAGVRAVRGSVRSATASHAQVNNAVNAALREMDRMAKDLSSKAK